MPGRATRSPLDRDEFGDKLLLGCAVVAALVSVTAAIVVRNDLRRIRQGDRDFTIWDSGSTSIVVAVVAGLLSIGCIATVIARL